MKKLPLYLFAVLAAALLWPAASLALTPRAAQPLTAASSRGVRTVFSLPTALRAALTPRARTQGTPGLRARASMLAVRAGTGPCTVTGRVLAADGSAEAGAEVDLWYTDAADNDQFIGYTYADDQGDFTFSGAPVTAQGEIDAFFTDDNGTASWNDTFTAAGPNDFTLQPGSTDAEVWRTDDPDGYGWTNARIDTWGSAGGGTTLITDSGGNEFATGSALVMPPDYDYAVAYTYANQGIEWNADDAMPVTPGTSDGQTMTFDEADGRTTWIDAPYWQSGAAGSKIQLYFYNWPAGYEAAFYGYSQWPATARVTNWKYPVQLFGGDRVWNLAIPKSATPGYDYELHIWRYDDESSELDLTTYFQVASLKASHASVHPGRAVRLTGVIPTQGHLGAQVGKVKLVTVYQRTKAAGPPTAWNPGAKGWRKIATVRANGHGVYTSPLLHPRHTTWYVVRYPGDGWYFRAYTSVIRVTVK
jgi:hypothetical protein